MTLKRWIAGLIPFILIFVVTWIPQINGPHLWFGIPSMFFWMLAVSTVAVPLVLLYFESTRDNREEEEPHED